MRKAPKAKSAPAILAAVIYARVSTKEQADEGYSIEAQLLLLRKYAADKGFEVIGEFVEAESAKASGRPAFTAMLKAAKERGATILVEKTDRLYRHLKDWVIVDELGVDIHLVKEGAILSQKSNSDQKFMHGLRVLMAKKYCDNLSEEAQKGMIEKARQGIWPTKAPVGYLNVATGSKRTIAVDPNAAPQIRKCFEQYATGAYSIRDIEGFAFRIGLRSKSGKPVAKSVLHLILTNPLFMGEVRWNGVTSAGVHEPIIDRETFEKVQAIIEGRGSRAGFGGLEIAYKGLITCGLCGCAITAENKKGRYTYYHCTGNRGFCPAKGMCIREEQITEQIVAHLEGLTIRPHVLELLKTALKASLEDEISFRTEQVEPLQREQKRLEGRLEQLYRDNIDGVVPRGVYDKLRAQWESELTEVEIGLRAFSGARRASYDDGAQLLELAATAAFEFKNASASIRRELLRKLQSNCTMTLGKLSITLKPWFDLILKANTEIGEKETPDSSLEVWLPVLDALRLGRVA